MDNETAKKSFRNLTLDSFDQFVDINDLQFGKNPLPIPKNSLNVNEYPIQTNRTARKVCKTEENQLNSDIENQKNNIILIEEQIKELLGVNSIEKM